MDVLDKQTLMGLANHTEGPCISIYIPTHQRGKQVNEGTDRIRFKNHLQQVRTQLQAAEMRSQDVNGLLAPLEELLDDQEFWRSQQQGLAVFRSPEVFEWFKSPVPFEEFSEAGPQFLLRPLFAFLQDPCDYYILTVTRKHAALFHADKHTIRPVEAGDAFPSGMDEVLEPYEFENETQGMPQSKAGSMQGEASVYRGSKEENKMKDHLLADYFRLINDGVKRLIGEQKKPLVLAAVEYYHPIYAEVNTHAMLHEKGLTGSFDQADPAALHRMANELMEGYFAQGQTRRITQYQNSSATDLTSHDLRHILESAVTGRINTLFVRQDAEAWGRFDEDNLTLTLHDQRQDGDESLVDRAVLLTLKNGGEIFLMDTVDLLPQPDDDRAGVAAIYRF